MKKLSSSKPFSNADLERLSKIIQEATGNQVLPKHHSMIEARMRSRFLKLGLAGVEDYWAHFSANREQETQALTSLMTTHYTFFFREAVHFEALHLWIEENHQRLLTRYKEQKVPLRVWSAACSKGQEIYSLAMFLEEELLKKYGVEFEVLGTDIDPESVQYARNGVYPIKETNSIPQHYLNQFWKRGTGAISDFAAVHPMLRKKTRFMPLNLLDLSPMKTEKPFDVIFVRNVFIYFSEDNVKSIALALIEHLDTDGVFVSGLSEPLRFEGWSLVARAPSFYQKSKDGAQGQRQRQLKLVPPVEESHQRSVPPDLSTKSTAASRYKVLCVDDSSTIQTLMKKIFQTDPRCSGVVSALNGQEARQKLDEEPFDLITLDIHMPVMGGIEFLETQYKKDQDPPVLMISSVNRKDIDLATKSLELGAADYVEKPAMNNLKQSTDEILTKVRWVLRSRAGSLEETRLTPSLDRSSNEYNQSIGQKIVVPDASQALRWIFSSGLDDLSLEYILKTASQEYRSPPLLVSSRSSALDLIEKIVRSASTHSVSRLADQKIPLLRPNVVYICDVSMGSNIVASSLQKRVSLQFLHEPDGPLDFLKPLSPTAQVLLDESLGSEFQSRLLREGLRVSDITPATSFVSLSLEYFAKLRGARAA